MSELNDTVGQNGQTEFSTQKPQDALSSQLSPK
jgi:hypothetical protein